LGKKGGRVQRNSCNPRPRTEGKGGRDPAPPDTFVGTKRGGGEGFIPFASQSCRRENLGDGTVKGRYSGTDRVKRMPKEKRKKPNLGRSWSGKDEKGVSERRFK